MMTRFVTIASVLSLLVPLAATEAAGYASRDQRYRLQPLDVVEIYFRFTPEFNQTVSVQPDGFITLQAAGEVMVAGLTVAEAKQAIAAKCSGTLREPVITVSVKEFSKPTFVVGGQVARPGRFDLRGETSLSDAIAIAGGFNPGAKEGEVLLFRRASAELVEVKKINLKHAIEKGHLEEDVLLRAGDAIYVSRSKVGRFERFMAISRLGLWFNPLPFL